MKPCKKLEKHVKWDRILKGLNAQYHWNIFSHKVGKLCAVNNPKITIKSHSQPPWFDSDVHSMCLKMNASKQNLKISRPCGLPKI